MPPGLPDQAGDQLSSRLHRVVVQHVTSSSLGRDILQVITVIPPLTESGWHTHPGEEVGFILEGAILMMIEGQPALTLGAGDGFTIPPDTAHNARDVGSLPGRMLSTYIVDPFRPLALSVKVTATNHQFEENHD